MLPLSSSDRPEPVIDAAKLAAAVSGTVLAIGAVLVLLGWATSDEVQSWSVISGGIVTSVGALLAVVMPLVTALGARAQVTPLAAPLGVDGVPLITSAATPAGRPLSAIAKDLLELAAEHGAPMVTAPPEPQTTPVDDREITDALRDLDEQDRSAAATTPIPGAWRPPTPAAVAAEPTPIADDAAAATTGRLPAVTT